MEKFLNMDAKSFYKIQDTIDNFVTKKEYDMSDIVRIINFFSDVKDDLEYTLNKYENEEEEEEEED
jgi:hypothetical protein